MRNYAETFQYSTTYYAVHKFFLLKYHSVENKFS